MKSNLCDYSDAYIVVKGTIAIEGDDDIKKELKKLPFKNKAPFRSCMSKINNTFINNAGDLDIVITMHNLLEYICLSEVSQRWNKWWCKWKCQ